MRPTSSFLPTGQDFASFTDLGQVRVFKYSKIRQKTDSLYINSSVLIDRDYSKTHMYDLSVTSDVHRQTEQYVVPAIISSQASFGFVGMT